MLSQWSYLDELGLDGGRVNALVVEELLHLVSDAHVVSEVLTADVGGRDDAVASQLPDVELMHRNHTRHLNTTHNTVLSASVNITSVGMNT